MATHFRILAWEIPWTEEPGGLQSVGLQKRWTQLSDQTTVTTLKMIVILNYDPKVKLNDKVKLTLT